MITNKRFLTFTMTTLFSLSLLSGCSSNSGGNQLDFSNSSLNATVTSVDNNVLTLTLSSGMGSRQMMGGGSGGGEMPSGDGDGQTPPDMPSEGTDSQTAPETPSDTDTENPESSDATASSDTPEETTMETASDTSSEATDDNKKDASGRPSDSGKSGGKEKPSGGSGSTTFTLTISDESVLADTSLSDITEGSSLTITFDDNNTITSIPVRKTSSAGTDNEN